MAADAMVPCFAKPSTAMILTVQHKQVHVFHGDRFQLPIMKNGRKSKSIFVFPEINSAGQGLINYFQVKIKCLFDTLEQLALYENFLILRKLTYNIGALNPVIGETSSSLYGVLSMPSPHEFR